jgi:hypothetical protein
MCALFARATVAQPAVALIEQAAASGGIVSREDVP